MTFLEIVQKVVRYSGMADSGPSAVTGQVGDYQKAIGYVQDAHSEIQSLRFDWFFLWRQSALTISPGVPLYPGPARLGIWDAQRIFLDGSPLPVIEWADYKPESVDPARPAMGVIRPDNQLQLVPAPDEGYHLSYEYYRTPLVMVENADTPLIPAQFRDVIVGRALMLYGNYESAADAKIQGAEMYQANMELLERHQLSRRQQTHGRQEAAPIVVVAE
ncbi:MAG: hypothetical protein WC997_15790 [Porticoccaceae bacterium]